MDCIILRTSSGEAGGVDGKMRQKRRVVGTPYSVIIYKKWTSRVYYQAMEMPRNQMMFSLHFRVAEEGREEMNESAREASRPPADRLRKALKVSANHRPQIDLLE